MRDLLNINTLENLPEFYHEILEIKELCTSLTIEFQNICGQNSDDLNSMFVLTSDEESLSIWEKEIYIRCDKNNDLLDFRKKRLINRYTTKPPFTIKWLQNQLDKLIDDNSCKITRDEAVQTLLIHGDISSFKLLKEFITTIEITLPLNMLYQLLITALRKPSSTMHYGSAAILHLHCVCDI